MTSIAFKGLGSKFQESCADYMGNENAAKYRLWVVNHVSIKTGHTRRRNSNFSPSTFCRCYNDILEYTNSNFSKKKSTRKTFGDLVDRAETVFNLTIKFFTTRLGVDRVPQLEGATITTLLKGKLTSLIQQKLQKLTEQDWATIYIAVTDSVSTSFSQKIIKQKKKPAEMPKIPSPPTAAFLPALSPPAHPFWGKDGMMPLSPLPLCDLNLFA